MENNKVIVLWSGGKDCCFALYKALQYGLEPIRLFTSMPQEDEMTYGHNFRKDLLLKQGGALGIPIDIAIVRIPDYRQFFLEALKIYKSDLNIDGAVFGDLYLMEHRSWLEDVCYDAGITPYFPLWIQQEQAYSSLLEFINLGFDSIIVKIRKDCLGEEWLGKKIDLHFASENKGKICPMGENGEFHSLVLNGPLFRKPLQVEIENKTDNGSEYGILLKPITDEQRIDIGKHW